MPINRMNRPLKDILSILLSDRKLSIDPRKVEKSQFNNLIV
ncbi:hypothetical protein SCARR_01115 [Pontiella sulfatireligans]|uniref:Uncharacterized protein n=1 Tax=Pontiella sulfatireligans TaxID=2750658 RepID=A0A6C2UGL0_9BACT|nr:hypothetical protein SCARR_01115 [Pontiella sulfatireligans]